MNIQITDPTGQIVQDKLKYPYLGKHPRGTVVLFTHEDSGVNLIANKDYQMGHHSESWRESDFIKLPPEVKITLSND